MKLISKKMTTTCEKIGKTNSSYCKTEINARFSIVEEPYKGGILIKKSSGNNVQEIHSKNDWNNKVIGKFFTY